MSIANHRRNSEGWHGALPAGTWPQGFRSPLRVPVGRLSLFGASISHKGSGKKNPIRPKVATLLIESTVMVFGPSFAVGWGASGCLRLGVYFAGFWGPSSASHSGCFRSFPFVPFYGLYKVVSKHLQTPSTAQWKHTKSSCKFLFSAFEA